MDLERMKQLITDAFEAEKITLYDIARPDMGAKAEKVFRKAIKRSCKEQERLLRKAKKLEKGKQ